MFVNQTGLGAIGPRIPRGGRIIRVPLAFQRAGRRGMGNCCVPGGDAACPCPPGMVGGSWLGQCTQCLDPNNLPAGCTSATDPLQIACQPALHGSYQLPSSSSPCASGYPGWVLGTEGTWTWCGSGPAPAYNPSNAPSTVVMTEPTGNQNTGGSGGSNQTWTSSLIIPSASLTNVSRPGQGFRVGDSWQLIVKGAPNSPVTDTATQNGTSLGTSPYGSTDASGTLSLSGTFTAGTVGNWSETWTVAGVKAPVINFTVAAAPPPAGNSNSTDGSGAAGAGGSAAGSTGGSTQQSSVTCFKLFGDPSCIGPLGSLTLAAGVVGVLLLSSIFGGRH